jgi:hypothetical protein
MSAESFYANIDDSIRRYGRSIIVVPGNFAYTIGNTLRGLPEIFVLGPVNPIALRNLLNIVADQMFELDRAFADGSMVSTGGRLQVCLINADDSAKAEVTAHVGHALQIPDADYSLQQMVLCDPHGRFPWDAQCHEPYNVKVYRKLSS